MAKSSRSPDRRRRRSRSNSSSSSNSDEEHRHSKSNRRTKRSRSRSRTRSKDGSNSKSKRPSRSLSRERRRRRSRSKGRSPLSLKKDLKSDKGKRSTAETTAGANTSLTPEEQLKNKMKMALKAAAEADAQLREKGVLTGRNRSTKEKTSETLSFQEQINRSDTINQINAPGFAPQDFISNADKLQTNDPSGSAATDLFSYDNQQANKSSITEAMDKLVQCELAHENLFANKELRQEKWVRRLYTMRQKRLNGDVMS